MRLRVGRVCSLLIGTAPPIAGIACDVGCTDPSLFNRRSVPLEREPPSGLRERHRVTPGRLAARGQAPASVRYLASGSRAPT